VQPVVIPKAFMNIDLVLLPVIIRVRTMGGGDQPNCWEWPSNTYRHLRPGFEIKRRLDPDGMETVDLPTHPRRGTAVFRNFW
jgi:hypothetical protein